jgi:hypothetical protein
MELRERILGPVAWSEPSPSVGDPSRYSVHVDFANLLRKLVLFERVIVESIYLDEFPLLVRKFGYDGVRQLLESGRVRILCDQVLAAQIGQTRGVNWRPALLPLGSYAFAIATIDSQPLIREHLQAINDVPGLSAKQAKKLRKLIGEGLVTPSVGRGQRALDQLKTDLDANLSVLRRSVAIAARQHFDIEISPNDFDLRMERIADYDWRAETNVGKVTGLDAQGTHDVVQHGLLGVGGLNVRIEQMETYSALTGFRRNELPLMDDKLGFLAHQLDPDVHEERFERVVELMGLPDVDPSPDVHDVDMARLLEITADPEVLAFRGWLRTIDTSDDADVAEQIHRIRDLVGGAVRSRPGKAVRLAATTGIGILVPPVGVALGVLDTFVTEKVIRSPGPTAFLSRLYPSVFQVAS